MPKSFLDHTLGQISSVMKTSIDKNPTLVGDFLDQIESGSGGIREKIQEIRAMVAAGAAKKSVSDKKLQLPAVYPHSVAHKNTVKAGISNFQLSGFVHFDLDGQSPSDAMAMLQTCEKLEIAPQIVFLSPSGNGIKIMYFVDGLVEASESLDAHGKKEIFNRVWYFLSEKVNATFRTIGAEVDRAPKNVMSTFFVSYDPNLRVNLKSDPIKLSAIPELKKKKNQTLVNQGLLETSNSILNSPLTSVTSVTAMTSTVSNQSSQLVSKPGSKLLPTSHLKFFGGRVTLQKNLEARILTFGLTPSNVFRANQAITSYLETPIGMGLRHRAFFSSSVKLAYAALSKDQILEILETLDYDESRYPEDAVQQLKNYGLIGKSASNQVKTDEALEHLKLLSNYDQSEVVSQWLSEAKDQILSMLEKFKVVVLDAQTGLGKTHFCLQELPKYWTGRIFFGIPTTALRSELSKKWAGDPRIQFLEPLQGVSPDAKVVVTTYEKMVYTRGDWRPEDLVVLDEHHLMELNFRSWGSQILLQETKNSQSPKFLLLSATGQGMGRAMKILLPSDVGTLKVSSQAKKKIEIELKICKSTMERLADEIKEKLKKPNSKLLVYRNSIDDLEGLAKTIGSEALIVSSESKASDPTVQSIFDGSEPIQRVLLATSLVEIGVSMPWITEILVCSGKGPSVQVSNLIQIADRARKAVTITWFVSKNRPNGGMPGHYEETFISKYSEIVDQWAQSEQKRMTFLLGPKKSKDFSEVGRYLKALDQSLSEHTASEVEFPMRGVLCASKSCELELSVQGILENIGSMEAIMEGSLKYKILKLEVLHGADIKISTCVDRPSPTTNDPSVWERLRGVSASLTPSEIRDDIEGLVDSLALRPRKKSSLLAEIWRRLMLLTQKKISVKEYLFLDDDDWTDFLYNLSLRDDPHLHKIEKIWAEEILNLGADKIFFEDAKEALKKISISSDHEPLRSKLLELPSQTLSKILSKFLSVKSGKTKNPKGVQARYLKLLSRIPKWLALKDEPATSPQLPPKLSDDDDGGEFPF